MPDLNSFLHSTLFTQLCHLTSVFNMESLQNATAENLISLNKQLPKYFHTVGS